METTHARATHQLTDGRAHVDARAAGIAWQDDADTLMRAYLEERGREIRTRLHALWLLRRGTSLPQVARMLGTAPPSVERWLEWYRQGGISEVRRRQYRGRAPRLTRAQQTALLERARTQPFHTTQDAQRWVETHLGVSYTHSGMRWLLERLGVKEQGTPLRALRRSA